MEKQTVFFIINSRFKDLSNLALSYVNLSDKERNTLIYRARKGLTQEETAEAMQKSKNTIQNYETPAWKKCAKAWENVEWIELFLKLNAK